MCYAYAPFEPTSKTLGCFPQLKRQVEPGDAVMQIYRRYRGVGERGYFTFVLEVENQHSLEQWRMVQAALRLEFFD